MEVALLLLLFMVAVLVLDETDRWKQGRRT